jgi:hypothetical protein
MQDNITEPYFSKELNEAGISKSIFLWASQHTQLCQLYVSEMDARARKEIGEKLEASLNYGKILVNSMGERDISSTKPLLPISGLNRFNLARQKEILHPLDKGSPFPFHNEIGATANKTSIPLPSRTYLKKKST